MNQIILKLEHSKLCSSQIVLINNRHNKSLWKLQNKKLIKFRMWIHTYTTKTCTSKMKRSNYDIRIWIPTLMKTLIQMKSFTHQKTSTQELWKNMMSIRAWPQLARISTPNITKPKLSMAKKENSTE